MPYSGEPAVELAALAGSAYNFIGTKLNENIVTALTAATWTKMPFSAAGASVEFDTAGLWLSTAPTVLTINRAGYYLLSCYANPGNATAADRKGVAATKAGAVPILGDVQFLASDAGTTALGVMTSGVIRLAVGDTIALMGFSTSAVNSISGSLSAVFLGKA